MDFTFNTIKLDSETREKLYNIDVEGIANSLYNMSIDIDFSDYQETKEKEIKDIIEALYQLKAICENPYNSDFYRTFLFCLQAIAENN